MRELCKMRYLWRDRVQLDDSKLKAFLGSELYTPFEQAVRAALVGAGCIREASGLARAPA
jgi:hypothetical protein